MNAWLIPSVIAVIVVNGILAFVCLLLWFKMRHKFILYWGVGWSFHFIRYIFDYIKIANPGLVATGFLIDFFSGLSVVFLLVGLLAINERLISKYRWSWALLAVTSLWSLLWNLKGNPQMASIPTFFAFGIIHFYIGISFLRIKDYSRFISSRVLGYGMLLWGIHKFNYPFVRFIPSFAPFGYGLGGVFAFVTAVFMLIFIMEKTTRERDISMKRFGVLFENTQDIILFFSFDGQIRDANEAAVRAYGYGREELLAMNIRQIRKGVSDETFRRQIEIANQRGISFETIHYRKDGTTFPVEANAVAATIGGESVIFSIIRDISERKRNEDALRNSEEKFRELFNNASDMIFLSDRKDNTVEVNQMVYKKLGYLREELDHFQLEDITSQNGLEVFPKVINELDMAGHATYEVTLLTKSGHPLLVEINSHVFNLNGKEMILSIARDISERKKAEAEIMNLTFTDKLTGLHNRVYFEEVLNTFDFEHQVPVSIIIGDVNGLKLVNDVFGHGRGDELLKGVAGIISESCRKDDITIRWGGDEFLLFLPHADLKTAEKICQRIQQKCLEVQFHHIQPSIALGCAVMNDPGQNILEVFRVADERMYRNKLLESKSARNSVISSLQKSLFEKSNETEQHAERLKKLALMMGSAIGLPQNQMDDLALLATLHDIGKIAIPEDILAKPGPLSTSEWLTMKKHPEIGFRIIQSVPDLAHIAEAVLAHHERWDGTGYPRRLSGEEIPLISRIIAIVDAFDAMTHQRVYRNSVAPRTALDEIERCTGTQFDPELVEVFLEIMLNQSEVAVSGEWNQTTDTEGM